MASATASGRLDFAAERTHHAAMQIRAFQSSDLNVLLAINTAGEPGVGTVTADKLDHLIAAGECHIAADPAGRPAGFILLHLPGTDYDGRNFNWFADRYESFVYVDRIAVANHARGQGIGQDLYQHVFQSYTDKALLIGCEVNSVPPNPGSLRFHKRLGFEAVGSKTYTPDYAVTYLAKRLGT